MKTLWFFGPKPEPEPEPLPAHAQFSSFVRLRRPPKTRNFLGQLDPTFEFEDDIDHPNEIADHILAPQPLQQFPPADFLALTLAIPRCDQNSDVHGSDEDKDESEKMKNAKTENSAPGRSRKRRGVDVGDKSKKSKKVGVIEGPNPAPPMPEELRRRVEEEMGGFGLRMILQKRLFKTDTNANENRFSMPVQKLEPGEFLSDVEMKECRLRENGSEDDGPIEGRPVRLIEPRGDDGIVCLKQWHYEHSSSYVFCGNWRDIVRRNGLQPGQILQVWFFRDAHGEPCFALVNLDK